jgi:hypothetical protein
MNRRDFIVSALGAATMAMVPDRPFPEGWTITEEIIEEGLFGLAPIKQEGASIVYDQVGERYARALAVSMRQTKEIVARNVLGRAFDDEDETEDGYTYRTFATGKRSA